MKMKTKIIILLSVIASICHVQSKAISKPDLGNPTLNRFVAEFRPDYALFNGNGAGLVRKKHQWSLVRIWGEKIYHLDSKVEIKLHFIERPVTKNDANKILVESAPDSLFSIGQEHFDSLPKRCEGEAGKKRGIAGDVSDAGTITVWEYTPSAMRKIQFYAADIYFDTCYPHQPEFEILGTLLHTFKVIGKYASEIDNQYGGQ